MQTLLRTLSLLLVGSLTAACVVQSDPTPGPKGDPGVPGTNGLNGKDGKDAVLPPELEARLEALENAAYCPRLVDNTGALRTYTPDLTMPGVVRCTYGADEMVKVGAFWIDRYEAVLVSADFYTDAQMSPPAHGGCNGSGDQFGQNGDDFPDTFPDTGNWSSPLYACSVSGVVPSASMTWYQAQQACILAGKRLCGNDEWQAAVAGTIDPGASDGGGGACFTLGGGTRSTGTGAKCRSNYGADDMIGNLAEWTADWMGAPGTDQLASCGNDPMGVPYGQDGLSNLSGTAYDPDSSGYGHRRPAAPSRGGRSNEGTAAGAFALDATQAPSYFGKTTGARCCAGGR